MLAPNSPIRLVAGLGNPDREYLRTRHNAGFWFADALARKLSRSFSMEKKFFGEVCRLDGDVWMVKPMTFMNRSGQAVAALAGFYQIKPEEILIVHDELDLRPGEVKLKMGGGVAGHNGLKDIEAQLGSSTFWRLRLGIGHPGVKAEVVNYVLRKPSAEHREAIEKSIEQSVAALDLVLAGEMERAMMKVHAKPPRPKPAPALERPSTSPPDGSEEGTP